MCHHGHGGPPGLPPPQPSTSGGHLGSHIGIGGAGVGPMSSMQAHCSGVSVGLTNSIGGMGGPPPPPPPLPPPPLCNPCSNSFNTVPIPGPSSSRWGPRTSCPVHSPFRVRVPNGSVCSGHQVRVKKFAFP